MLDVLLKSCYGLNGKHVRFNKHFFLSMSDFFEIPTPELEEDNYEMDSIKSKRRYIRTDDESIINLNHEELSQLIREPHSYGFDNTVIIDARFVYEYRGGQIRGAINVKNRQALYRIYKTYKDEGDKIAFVFHCEFSHDRGPKVLKIFRSYDREKNAYPNLSFPHIYLLEGGFNKFYEHHPDLCLGDYVPMRHSFFKAELKSCTTYFKKNMLLEKSSAINENYGSQDPNIQLDRSFKGFASCPDLKSPISFSQPIFSELDL